MGIAGVVSAAHDSERTGQGAVTPWPFLDLNIAATDFSANSIAAHFRCAIVRGENFRSMVGPAHNRVGLLWERH
jgi:hypothetical protein